MVRRHEWKGLSEAVTEDPVVLNHRDERGRNWLHLCASVDVVRRGSDPRAGVRTADALMEAGLGLNDPAFGEGDWRATPLWFAIAFGRNLPLARHFLRLGANPDYCLWAAVNRDSPDAIDLLFEHGAPDPGDAGSSLLLAAVEWKKPAAARALLRRGADVDFRASNGQTALHRALGKRRDADWIRLLIDYGARTDIPDADGETAMEILSRKRDPAFRALPGRLGRKG